jgi:DNA-binding beta-propeller fold protein YncE
MSSRKAPSAVAVSIIVLLTVPLLGRGLTAGIKLKVIVENTYILMAPKIGSQKLAKVAPPSILDAEPRQGDFYKVSLDQNGVRITGYVHYVSVQEVSEREAEQALTPAGLIKTQADIEAQIETRIEENKDLIVQEKDPERAEENLRPLLARTFALEDRQKQKQLACQVYYWLGVALAKQGDKCRAVQELRNMLEVDAGFAAEVTRNVPDPVVSRLMDNAEKQYNGTLIEYSVSINTEPQAATIKVDGKVISQSPHVYLTPRPKFILEIEKEGYAPEKRDICLTDPSTPLTISLRSIGRPVQVSSTPAGAKVFLDGQDTGKVTPCNLSYVPYAEHGIRLTLENYADWEESCPVVAGEGVFPVSAVLTVKNYAPFKKWGGLTSKFCKFPKAVALDASGTIYIADESDYKIRKYDPEFRTLNWNDPQLTIRNLDVPAGLAFDGQGTMYVTDSRNSTVTKFDKNGKQIGRWGRQGLKNDELSGPTGIAVDKNNDVYVADTGNNRIVKCSAVGAFKKTWGRRGAGQGDFFSPTGIAVNAKNEILVVDMGGRVQKFTAEGVYIGEFGKLGSGEGDLNRPLGICLDRDGYIYVADTANNRIQKFAPNGKVVTQWGGSGSSGGQLTSPAGVAVSDKGSVFIAEKDVHRIQEFRVPAK